MFKGKGLAALSDMFGPGWIHSRLGLGFKVLHLNTGIRKAAHLSLSCDESLAENDVVSGGIIHNVIRGFRHRRAGYAC